MLLFISGFSVATALATLVVLAVLKRVGEADRAAARADLLLREATHRIRNNLQVVMSLLRIQRRTLKSEEAKAALETAMARVGVMARIHARLSATDTTGSVEMDEFIRSLCADIRKSMTGDRPIDVTVETESAVLDCGRASAVGLVVNELMTNALRHGFPDGKGGRVTAAFRRLGDCFEVEVTDDGAGLEAGTRPGLGQTLVSLFARQLGGTLHRAAGPGTRHFLRFPVAGP